MSATILPKGTMVLLLTSYCPDEKGDCSDSVPCSECLKMCNTFEIRKPVPADYKGQFDKDA